MLQGIGRPGGLPTETGVDTGTESGDCQTARINFLCRQGNGTIPATRARPDLAFCLPVQIQLDHRDYAWLVTIALHGIALWIILTFLAVEVVVPLVVAACCSLRYRRDQQSELCGYHSLVCDHTGQWFVVADDQRRQWIALDRLQMPGPFLLIRLRHFDGTVFWITFQRRQAAAQWGRLRALCRLV